MCNSSETPDYCTFINDKISDPVSGYAATYGWETTNQTLVDAHECMMAIGVNDYDDSINDTNAALDQVNTTYQISGYDTSLSTAYADIRTWAGQNPSKPRPRRPL
jgi:hypothetical protein